MKRIAGALCARSARAARTSRAALDSGSVELVGAIYEVETGRVTFLNP